MAARTRAVLFDFGGVFTPSPFDGAREYGARIGASPERVLDLVFGPYQQDTDHPWHRLERGEIALMDARSAIVELGRAEGIDADPFKLFASMEAVAPGGQYPCEGGPDARRGTGHDRGASCPFPLHGHRYRYDGSNHP